MPRVRLGWWVSEGWIFETRLPNKIAYPPTYQLHHHYHLYQQNYLKPTTTNNHIIKSLVLVLCKYLLIFCHALHPVLNAMSWVIHLSSFYHLMDFYSWPYTLLVCESVPVNIYHIYIQHLYMVVFFFWCLHANN